MDAGRPGGELREAGLKLSNQTMLSASLAETGFDSGAFEAWVARRNLKAQPLNDSEATISCFASVSPLGVVGGQVSLDQDRLKLVREALS